MPDEEPHALAEMEEKYANMLGVPHYDGKRKRTEPFNASLEQMQAKLMNPRLIEQDFRFLIFQFDFYFIKFIKMQVCSNINR